MSEAFLAIRLAGVADAHRAAARRTAAAADALELLLRGVGADPEPVLAAARAGLRGGAADRLCEPLRACLREQAALLDAAQPLLDAHPVWGWLSSLPGLDQADAVALLARLELGPSPRAFHRACGLEVQEGARYRCEACGLDAAFPRDRQVEPAHSRLGGTGRCEGRLAWVSEGRVARPLAVLDGSAGEARAAIARITLAAVEAGGAYARAYARERERLDLTRPGWSARRMHRAALRKLSVRLLARLWAAWRAAEPTAVPIGGRALSSRAA